MEPIKTLSGIATALSLSTLIAMPTFAGTWQQLEGGKSWQWKYVENDGSYSANNWQLINEKWYHFDADGYLDVGLRKIDDNYYLLMKSGALETNRDYGFASSDANGVWTVKPLNYEDPQETNKYAEYCRQYGIDIDAVFSGVASSNEYTYNCSIENFPKDSEGNIVENIVARCISEAIQGDAWYWGIYCAPYNYTWNINNNIFSITFTEVPDEWSTGHILNP